MASETTVHPTPAEKRWIVELGRGAEALGLRVMALVRSDWRDERALAGGALTALLSCLLVAAFHLNRPLSYLPYHDAYEYVRAADRIAAGGWWIDASRMPGYPMLLAGIFVVFGKDNLAAADAVQQGFFVLAAVQVYVLGLQLWRRTRHALVAGALFATNFYFLNYVKPILSDGLALVLTLALALLALAFLKQPSARGFWLVVGCALALIMTRAEWLLFPVPLFAVMLWSVRERIGLKRMLPHAVAAMLLVYGLVAGCIALNARVNGYAGLTDAQEINLYGKVTQYHMQDLAPPQYAELTHLTDWYVADQHADPWYIERAQPWLGADHFKLLGAYARAIVVHHPAQFIAKSVPMAFRSLYQYSTFEPVNPAGREAGALNALQQFSAIVYPLFMLFPFVASGWAVALAMRRQRHTAWSRYAAPVCLVSLMALYDLIMTTLGSYGEYTRLHLSFDPLMLVVVMGTLMLLAGARRGAAREDATLGRPDTGDVTYAAANDGTETGKRRLPRLTRRRWTSDTAPRMQDARAQRITRCQGRWRRRWRRW